MHILLIHVDEFINHRYEITQIYLQEDSAVKVVVIADTQKESEFIDAIHSGVHGYLLKDMKAELFVDAIKKIAKGMIYIDAKLSMILLKSYEAALKHHAAAQEVLQPVHLYTKREYEVLQLLTDGQSNDDIAATLKISKKTVKNHVSNIFKKMNVHSRTEAVVKAVKNNWVSI